MNTLNKTQTLTKEQKLVVRGIASGMDTLQILLAAVTVEGVFSPIAVALDAVTCVLLTRVMGWRKEFGWAVVGKGTPGLDLVPIWSVIIWRLTRDEQAAPEDDAPQLESPK